MSEDIPLLQQVSEHLAQAQTLLALVQGTPEAHQMQVSRGVYEALVEFLNAGFYSPAGHDYRLQDASLDRAGLRVFYEMTLAKGAELAPFEDWLKTRTDFYHMHPEQAAERSTPDATTEHP